MKNIHVISTDTLSRLGRFIDTNNLFLRTYNDIPRGENVHIYIADDGEIKEGDWFIRGDEIHKCFSVYKTDIEFLTSIDSVYCGSNTFWNKEYCKKIILTTDEDLIQYGVQAIDDDFLQWFVKNPSCEQVKIDKTLGCIDLDAVCNFGDNGDSVPCPNAPDCLKNKYKIIYPKEHKTAWVGVLHDKMNEYHPTEYELKYIYQGEGCLPHFPNEELCQIWCDSKYKEEPKQETLEEAAKNESVYFGDWQGIDRYQQGFIESAKLVQEQMYSKEDMLNFAWFLLENVGQYSCDRTAHFEGKYLEQFKKK